jgi:hypothetical protein
LVGVGREALDVGRLEDEVSDRLADSRVGRDEALGQSPVLAAEDGGQEVADEGRIVGAFLDDALLLGPQPPVAEQVEDGVEELVLAGLRGKRGGDFFLLGEVAKVLGGAEGGLEELDIDALLARGGIAADFFAAFGADAGAGEGGGLFEQAAHGALVHQLEAFLGFPALEAAALVVGEDFGVAGSALGEPGSDALDDLRDAARGELMGLGDDALG